MRTLTLILALVACLTGAGSVRAQSTPPLAKGIQLPTGTTQEEYNYATQGLKLQRAAGLDLKAGYSLSNPTTLPVAGYAITLEDLVRTSTGAVACTVMQVGAAAPAAGQSPRYFCIPNPGSSGDIWGQYLRAQQQIASAEVLRVMNYALANRLSAMTTAAMLAVAGKP